MWKCAFTALMAGALVVACDSATVDEPRSIRDPDGSLPQDANAAPEASVAPDSGIPSDPACARTDPFPSVLQNPEALDARRAELRFVARDGNVLSAYTHRSASFDPASGRVLFVIHGASRNAEEYLDAWRDAVDAAGALAIAPEFPLDLYPSSESFNLGVGMVDTPESTTYRAAEWRNPDDYTLSEVEHLFEATRIATGNTSCRYLMYGHSAGGQFVHRLVTFRPDARVARAVAANAGWYTLPSYGQTGDRNFVMPYGLAGTPPDPTRLTQMFAHELVVLLGEDDVLRDDELRTSAQADAQGINRFERGQFFFAIAQDEAAALGVPLRWVLDTVPGVAHSGSGMSIRAAQYLFAQ